MSDIIFKKVSKKYGNLKVLHDLNFKIPSSSLTVLVGPSGCGKSTLLRMIAGLEEISEGQLFKGKECLNKIPPKDRDIAMVFQNYALYPHMSVFENMAFSLKIKKNSKTEIQKKVHKASQTLGIQDLLTRKPAQLSGGQRQRVAMGRALVRDASIFLFDEPLSNLDAKLRTQMRAEIKKIHETLKCTTVYVTHDQVEAMTLADYVVVLKEGRIEQMGSPEEVYNKAENVFVGGFMGNPPMAFSEVPVLNDNIYLEDIIIGKIPPSVCTQDKVIIGIRPESLNPFSEVQNPNKSLIRFSANIEMIEAMGSHTLLHCRKGKSKFIAQCNGHQRLNKNKEIELAIAPQNIHVFDIASQKNLSTQQKNTN